MNWVTKIEPEKAREVLEQAIRTQAQVVLEIAAVQGATVNGFIVSGDDHTLLMEVTGRPSLAPTQLVEASCEARLYMEKRYSFPARIQLARKLGETVSLALSRPTVLGLVERRRFQRARLAPSSRVTLQWDQGGVAQRHIAVLLNVSVDGLACRLESGAVATLESQSVVRVQFALPGSDHRFDLPATICNRTAASAGHTVIGLHLQPGSEQAADVAELERLLKNPRPARESVEVGA